MSLAKSSLLIIPQDSSPVKSPKADTISILHTQASSDDITSFSENFSEKSVSSPNRDSYPLEGISLKLQLLTRTGISASRISLLSSSCNGQSSFAQSVSMPCEEARAQESLLLDKLPKQNIKAEVVQEVKVRDEFRDKYIGSLKTRNILDSEAKKKHQSFMLVDWDGALFGGVDIEEVKNNQKFIKGDSILRMLDETASKLLAKAAAHCPVFIVTSYSEKNVEYSLRLYLPLTNQVFEKYNIEIISLQADEDEKENYASAASQEPKTPKGLMDLKKKFREDIGTNIMCVVDSETKIDIIQKFTGKFEGALVKFMRFKDSVKVSQLMKQQELLIKEFENIFFSLRSFTMQFAKTQGKK